MRKKVSLSKSFHPDKVSPQSSSHGKKKPWFWKKLLSFQ